MGHQEPGSPGMRLHDIFHIDPAEPVFLAENSFYDQKQSPLTERYLKEIAAVAGSGSSSNSSIQLIDPGSRTPIAVAVYVRSQDTCHWLVLTNVISKNTRFPGKISDIFGSQGEIIETNTSDLREAIVEYYSVFLVNRWLCESCAREEMPYLDLGTMVSMRELLNETPGGETGKPDKPGPAVRNKRLTRLVRKATSGKNIDPARADVLEICCGDGSATGVLREIGCDPICIDHDMCDICDGLKSGALHEKRSIVLDAVELSLFFDREFDCVAGFMIGPIQPFNKDAWASVLHESVKVVRTPGLLIFTFHNRDELLFATDVLDDYVTDVEVLENTPDIGYDRWVYVGLVK
ncbi:MAG: class I SAM-dependent methyltransferase [Methanosarcinales archaeon]|nr:MAG: class I SAM-dependent methyltransferase [Methanosarcinales archaeon]